MNRELDRAYLKRPGRGVPPPRSGPPPFVVIRATYQIHAFFDMGRAGMAEQLPVHVNENSVRAWGAA